MVNPKHSCHILTVGHHHVMTENSPGSGVPIEHTPVQNVYSAVHSQSQIRIHLPAL